MREVILKKGREYPVQKGHFWIFSGAIAKAPKFEDGEILRVLASDKTLLGHAFFNNRTDIAGRMINLCDANPYESIKSSIHAAIKKRENLINQSSNCFRLINSEGDNLSGLIVDRYGPILVMQIATAGFARMREQIVEYLASELGDQISCIFEKSSGASREIEGLATSIGTLWGSASDHVIVNENGIKFKVDYQHGQKTGLFLDMRKMRALVGEMSSKRKVLNCFCYTGGFSLYAARGGASRVHSIDVSENAIMQAKENFALNEIDCAHHRFTAADVFSYLSANNIEEDFVIVDPPAFAKKKHHVAHAQKGYLELNRLVFAKIPRGSLFLTCSCSHFIDAQLFEKTIAQAAAAAKRRVTILQRHRLAFDHPINLQHPETEYLKSLLLSIDN